MARHAYVLFAVSLVLPTLSASGARAQNQGSRPATPSAPAAAAPGDRPPPEYYVEPPTGAPRPVSPAARPDGPPPGAIYEPPPPGFNGAIYEPPPPPKPHHVAPKYSFWLGPRVGWFIPFGNLWYDCNPSGGNCAGYRAQEWNDVASSGPMFELDLGARLARNYNLFVLWERANLSSGQDTAAANTYGGFDSANTDYFGLGLRVSSDADKIGFLTEINLGVRRFRAKFKNGEELQLSEDVPLEARIGLGADIRLSPHVSLSPMVTLGVGRFDNVEWVGPGGKREALDDWDELASHGWLTFQMGAHFDVAGGG